MGVCFACKAVESRVCVGDNDDDRETDLTLRKEQKQKQRTPRRKQDSEQRR